MKKIAYYTSGIILIVTVWIIMSEVFTESIIPYPHKVLLKLCQILMLPSTYINLAITIIRTLSGFALAFVIGTGIGIATGSILAIERTFFFPVIILQGAPPILWIIPLMLIVGTEGAAPVAVVFFITLPLVIINIQEGRKTISPLMRDMFRIYADSKKMKLTELIIPSLAPYLKTILILGIILALKSSIIGEWFGAKNGIGRIVNEYFYTFDMTSFYATALLFLIIVGILAFFSRWVGNYFFPNRRKSMTAEKNKFIPNNYFNPAFTSLDLKNVLFSYSKKNIISLEHFHISSGETAVLTGNSGCGKTTLAKIICGILKPHSGSVSLPCNPGMIFQEDVLLNHLDCFGNASLPARWKRIQGYESITLYFLDLCELTENINLYPDELSGGMKKLLSFARALLLNPDFMILDEPFNNLHKEARIKLWDMYFELFVKRKISSVIITHYPEELTNRDITLYEMKEGNIIRSK